MPDSPTEPPVSAPPHQEVHESELLMRRVLLRKTDFRRAFTPPIQEGAFWPGKNDDTGISLSRRCSEAFPHFLNEWQLKAHCRIKDQNLREKCGVCAIFAQVAISIGLEIKPDPTDDDKGHVLFPQINARKLETEEDRKEMRLWIARLIEEASKLILIEPGTMAPPDTPKPADAGVYKSG